MKSVAYCHSGLRPGIQCMHPRYGQKEFFPWIPGLSPE